MDKDQLIKAATEKGFSPEFTGIYSPSNGYQFSERRKKLNHYLWLCELQKWLMDNHDIELRYYRRFTRNDEKYGGSVLMAYIRHDEMAFEGVRKNRDIGVHPTYPELLESFCLEALKLIK